MVWYCTERESFTKQYARNTIRSLDFLLGCLARGAVGRRARPFVVCQARKPVVLQTAMARGQQFHTKHRRQPIGDVAS